MKKILVLASCLVSTLAFAQDAKVHQSSMIFNVVPYSVVQNESGARFDFLKMDVEVTSFIPPGEFQSVQLDDVAVTLFETFSSDYDEFKNNPSKFPAALVGVSGYIGKIKSQKLYLRTNDQVGFRSYEVLGGSVYGLFRVKDKVFARVAFQMSALGLANVSNNDEYHEMMVIPADQREQLLEKVNFGADPVTAGKSRIEQAHEGWQMWDKMPVNLGLEADIEFKRLKVSLFGKMDSNLTTSTTYKLWDQDPEELIQVDLRTKVVVTRLGASFEYKLFKLKNLGDVSVFARYTLHSLKRRYEVERYTFDRDTDRTTEHTEPVELPGSIRTNIGEFNGGLKLRLRYKSKHQF
ncbi:MAG: hypothetical protein JNL01_02525 [Bdellovibrionales bacterium]|nr:hypothetical protein [Bdellovibrionales bacterium]